MLLRVQVLIWLNTDSITSSFVWPVCSWLYSPVGYGDVSLLPDGHDLPGTEAWQGLCGPGQAFPSCDPALSVLSTKCFAIPSCVWPQTAADPSDNLQHHPPGCATLFKYRNITVLLLGHRVTPGHPCVPCRVFAPYTPCEKDICIL